jgi:hypothetical protein
MTLDITQTGQTLSGTTFLKSVIPNSSGTTYNDTGTINNNGDFTLVETPQGGGTAMIMYGSIVGPGQLGGTWTSESSAGGSGTWNVART